MAYATRRRRSKAKGIQFTVMVVEVLTHSDHTNPEAADSETGIAIKPVNEEGMRINLTVVDTPGFGDNIDNNLATNDILAEQSRIKRNPQFRDNRVHALLYFIQPGPGTLSELRAFKKRIMEDIQHYDIPIYNFPYDVEEDDEETIQENLELRALMPFAVIGSEEDIEIDGESVRGRAYPWGVVEVDNPDHCDFVRLKSALFSSHLYDLRSLTEEVLYEVYRTEKLSKTIYPDAS
ncbi:hypothetical protein MPER_08343 [Moniliophthora perniciosa FA553]|nr:hypothetical protein MPER_08343 [Moniliophthora perniciosa FA553]